jgi:hypothetical protein
VCVCVCVCVCVYVCVCYVCVAENKCQIVLSIFCEIIQDVLFSFLLWVVKHKQN